MVKTLCIIECIVFAFATRKRALPHLNYDRGPEANSVLQVRTGISSQSPTLLIGVNYLCRRESQS